MTTPPKHWRDIQIGDPTAHGPADAYDVYAANMGMSDFEDAPPKDLLLNASSACPVCGISVPHSHSLKELQSLRRKVAYLESKLGVAALAAPLPEPVATVIEQGDSKFPMFTEAGLDLPAGTPLYTAPIAAAQGEPRPAAALIVAPPVAAAAPLPEPPEHWAPVMFRLMEAASHALAGNEFEVGRDQLFVAYKEAKALDPLGVMLRHRGTESDLTARPAIVCSICGNPRCEGTHAAPPNEMQTHAAHWVNETERSVEAVPRPVPTPSVDMQERLRLEADLCRNEGASDIADLLDEAATALATQSVNPEENDMTEEQPVPTPIRLLIQQLRNYASEDWKTMRADAMRVAADVFEHILAGQRPVPTRVEAALKELADAREDIATNWRATKEQIARLGAAEEAVENAAVPPEALRSDVPTVWFPGTPRDRKPFPPPQCPECGLYRGQTCARQPCVGAAPQAPDADPA